MCGCGFNGKCNYCNLNYFIGYDQKNTQYKLFQNVGLKVAPNSNGNTCSLKTQAIDVD